MCLRIALPVHVTLSKQGSPDVDAFHGIAVGSQMREEGLVGPRAQGHSGEADHHFTVRAAERSGTIREHVVKVVRGEPGDRTAPSEEIREALRAIAGV